MTSVQTVVMVFNGEYDLASRTQLRAALTYLAHVPRAILDFNDVTYIDSTALSELTLLHQKRTDGNLDSATIVAHNGNILRLFEVVDMGRFFNFADSVDDLVSSNDGSISVHQASSFAGDEPVSRS